MKPTLSVDGARLFYRICHYARKYVHSEYGLTSAASDVMDGNYGKKDRCVQELTSKGIIEYVGDSWHLSDYGRALVKGKA